MGALQLADGKTVNIYTDSKYTFTPFVYMGLHLYKKEIKNNLKPSHSTVASEFRQVERTNRTLKTQMSKLCQETHLTWKQILPLALLKIWCSPTKQTGFSPYEILSRSPPPLVKGIKRDFKKKN
jgi:hypothetical protein